MQDMKETIAYVAYFSFFFTFSSKIISRQIKILLEIFHALEPHDKNLILVAY